MTDHPLPARPGTPGSPDGPADPLLDRATRLATAALGTPVALVSIVTDDRQVFVGQTGLDDPVASERATPLTHSVCQFIVRHEVALGFDDLQTSRWVRSVIDVDDLGVASYLGVPLHDASGAAVGSFCVIDHEPRAWTDEDLAVLADLAALVDVVLQARGRSAVLEDELRAAELERAGLAHDLRGQTAAVRGGVETLKRVGLGGPGAGEVLEILDRKSAGLEEAVGSVLASVDGDAEKDVVDLAALVREVVADAAGDHPGPVEVDVPDGLSWPTQRAALRRVLTNLVDNAGKYGGAEATIAIRAEVVGDDLRITVADDGPGFDLPEGEDPFEAFRRGDRVGDRPGHGLGLYVVRQLARRLGGDVAAESGDDTGARVTVTLPRA